MKPLLNPLLSLAAFDSLAASSHAQVATSTPSQFLAGDKAIRLATGEQAAPEIAVNPPSGPAPLNVTLVSDGSYDPDGAVGNREWTFSDGGSYFGHTAFHTYSQLKVFDNDGATGITTKTVVVQ
ncbi:MAG: PKD domain-containing protein [Verrucomicrobiota bacterium]|nr:PKD domain-containing protein [Chthoniobacterales bacterium]MDQ3415149.1 PKD domain-containing protein [Verrucomicrobiota bacterium]